MPTAHTYSRNPDIRMIFEPLDLDGAYLIKPELHEDERGYFARSFCKNEFQEQGLVNEFVQCNISFNKREGTLRGMHFQKAPYEETKLIQCTHGSIYDVIIDIRENSHTQGQWLGLELTEDSHSMLYVPAGFAHGFITLTINTVIQYQISISYDAASAAGIRWDEPILDISWPLMPKVISDRDRSFPDFTY